MNKFQTTTALLPQATNLKVPTGQVEERVSLAYVSSLTAVSLSKLMVGHTGRIYILSDNFVSRVEFKDGRGGSYHGGGGEGHVGGIDGSIESLAGERDCLGFVAASQKAQKALDRHRNVRIFESGYFEGEFHGRLYLDGVVWLVRLIRAPALRIRR